MLESFIFWGAVAASTISGVAIGVVVNYISTIKARAVEIQEIYRDVNAIRSDIHQLRVSAINRIDELRRRIIALERRTHGFDLDGSPHIIIEKDHD